MDFLSSNKKSESQFRMGSICWAQVTAKLPCHRTKEQVLIEDHKSETILWKNVLGWVGGFKSAFSSLTFPLKYDERRTMWDTIDVNGNGYVSFSEISTVSVKDGRFKLR